MLLGDLQNQLNDAVKSHEEVRVSTLRFLLANLHNAKIAKGNDLTDEEVVDEIRKDAKRHRESIEAFKKGGRQELADAEGAQLAVLESFLPKMMEKEEIEKIVSATIAETGAVSKADFGKVMAAVMPKVAGLADGVAVSAVVGQKLK